VVRVLDQRSLHLNLSSLMIGEKVGKSMNKVVAQPIRAARYSVSQIGAGPYVAAIFLSAALVFLVQPMFAKMATPLLGGAPNVWNVSLVCFQAALLLGYAYAHLLNHFVTSLRKQVGIHAALLVSAALVLPFQLSGALGDPDPSQPTLWLIGVFALSIAPPFAVIAATAPLIQSWYSRSGRADAHDPYHLYGASNIGSLIGLLAYPLLLEPLLPLAAQTVSWSIGYGALAVLLIASGLIAYSTGGGAAPALAATTVEPNAESIRESKSGLWKQRLWWLACAFVPSSLLVGVTTHISTDIASVPFLWVAPLVIYISTFIIVFAKRPIISLEQSNRLLPLGAAIAALGLSAITSPPIIVGLAIHLLVLFLAALVAHGAMADDRPEAKRLTEFYLIMSLGGVLGGAFNALLAPVLFSSVIEYPLMLLAILLIRPNLRWMGEGRTRVWSLLAVAALCGALVLQMLGVTDAPTIYRILHFIAIISIVFAAKSRMGPVIAAACAFGISAIGNPVGAGISDRGFFGVVKIVDREGVRVLMHGTTSHGSQFLAAEKALQPTTYYATETPIGQVFNTHHTPGNVGVVGLGTGSVACYAQPDQAYVYYEIDPLVVKYAKDPAQFTYLSECTPDAEIILGDGRLNLAAEPAGMYNLLLIDAFSSDSIPVHLMTVEAVELYLSRLSDDGLLVMHISNRHLDLSRIVARIADQLGVAAYYQFYTANDDTNNATGAASSQVVILARSERALDAIKADSRWSLLETDGKRAWRDDYSNVIGAILAKHK